MTDSNNSDNKGPDLECKICFDIYQDPKVLPCGHSFCAGCILGPNSSSATDKTLVTCHLCRNETLMPAKGFPTNFALKNLVEGCEKSSPVKHNCNNCNTKHLMSDMWCCIDCNLAFICSKCSIKNHQKHVVEELENTMEKREKQFYDWQQNINAIVESINSDRNKIYADLKSAKTLCQEMQIDLCKELPRFDAAMLQVFTDTDIIIQKVNTNDFFNFLMSQKLDASLDDMEQKLKTNAEKQKPFKDNLSLLLETIINTRLLVSQILSQMGDQEGASGNAKQNNAVCSTMMQRFRDKKIQEVPLNNQTITNEDKKRRVWSIFRNSEGARRHLFRKKSELPAAKSFAIKKDLAKD